MPDAEEEEEEREDSEPEALPEIPVTGSIRKHVGCEYGSVFRYVDTEGNDLGSIEMTIHLPEKSEAPIEKGDKAGEAVYSINGEEIGKVDILYSESVEKSGYGDYLKHCIEKTTAFQGGEGAA